MRRLLLAALTALSACPPPAETDAGMVVDAGPPVPCDSPDDCKVAAFPGVCRQGVCSKHVPCADDLECGLGEACQNRECAFIGCVSDAECPTGRCRADTFSCAECAENFDCPFNRGICQQSTQKCVECLDDTQCMQPGPAHCEAVSGSCQHCLRDEHCPNGLTCSGGTCAGVPSGGACPTGTSCAEGLTCVQLGNQPVCLQSCNAYAPACPTGQICYTLKFSGSSSYVFDMGGLLGVCYTPVQNARNYRDSCQVNNMGLSNCQPSLACVPDSSQTSTCRSYCDPAALGACPSPEICHHFPGDYNGREYGLCYADNGFGQRCTGDARCRAGQSCQPYPDPSSFEELSPFCLFNVGASPGLAPCASGRAPDGGVVGPDRVCQSGACRSDSTLTPPYACYAACATDTDCSIGGRSGTCDETYEFVTPDGFPASLAGCWPGCESNATCAQYLGDGGLVCHPRLLTGSMSSGLKLNCTAPTVGGGGAGAPCAVNRNCTSGFCSFDDARGVRRAGSCLEACQTAADCAATANGGATSGPLDCLPTTYLGYRGADRLPGTPDDVLTVKRVCSGIACNEDEDCSSDGGARCVPDVSPSDAGAYLLRCRAPVLGGSQREAGVACAADSDCAGGACGTLADTSRVCFRACDPVAMSACPAGLTCRAGAFRFTSTMGTTVTLDGCAP